MTMMKALGFMIAASIGPAVSLSCAQSASYGLHPAQLVGTWVQESASAVSYTHIEITLRADGTYTKTLLARTPVTYGGAVGSSPTLGGTHSGTWTANGTVVNLSGDGNWPPYRHDLRLFKRR